MASRRPLSSQHERRVRSSGLVEGGQESGGANILLQHSHESDTMDEASRDNDSGRGNYLRISMRELKLTIGSVH